MASDALVDASGRPLSTNGHNATGVKEVVEPSVLAESVIDYPKSPANSPGSIESSLIWQVAQAADEITPWGRSPKERDRQLREFYPTESQFSSALGMVIARNIGFNWVIEGEDASAEATKDVLENANSGEGWDDLVAKISMDLYTQDHGAFMEFVREGNKPEGAFIGINSLDAGKCWHTGDPRKPVVYQDRLGSYHTLDWWSVATLAEMPTSIERLYGMQICALSRLLLAAQITKNIAIYKKEKTGGRHNRALHLIQGMTSGQIKDALTDLQSRADMQGLTRYINPLIVGTIDPKANIDVKTLELSSLPDGFNEADMFKHYIAWIAMAFLTDYQEFAPLPGGNLGTSSQSEIMHAKTRGKGPALWMKISSRALNMRALPSNVQFRYAEQDIEAEMERVDAAHKRGEERALRIESGEISQDEAREMALEDGDMTQEMFNANTAPEPIVAEVKPGAKVPSKTPRPEGEKELGQLAEPFQRWRASWE